MKKLFYTLLAVLLYAVPLTVTAQVDDDDENDVPEIAAWRGGNVNFGFRMGLDLMGSSIGTGSIGGLISPAMNSGAGSLTRNPAELAFNANRRHLVYNSNLALGTSRYNFLENTLIDEVNNSIITETDNILDDPGQVNFIDGGFRSYTSMRSAGAEINHRYPSFAVSVPLHDRFVVGLSTHTPVEMGLKLDLTGFQAKLAQEQGSDDVSIRFDILMNIGLITDFSLNMQAFNAGFGSLIFDRPDWGELGVGFTYSNYTVRSRRYIDADLSGMVVVSSADERFFNNPNDVNLNSEAGETNRLSMQVNANYREVESGYTFGLYYKAPINRTLGISLVYNHMPTFTMTDPNAIGEVFLPIFVLGDDLFNDKIEVDLNILEASKPNLTTQRDVTNLVGDMVLSLPSSLSLGIDLGLGPHNMVFNYTNYSGDFSLRTGSTSTLGKQTKHGVGFGIDMKMKDQLRGWNYALIPVRLLFLDFDGILMQSLRKYTNYTNPRYRFGFSAMLGEGIGTGDYEDLQSTLGMPLPTGLAWGRSYRVFDSADIGLTVFSFPDLFFKFSVGISLY